MTWNELRRILCTKDLVGVSLVLRSLGLSLHLSISIASSAGSRPVCVPLHQLQQLLVVGVACPDLPVARSHWVWVRPPDVASAPQVRAVLGGGADETAPCTLEFRVSPLEDLFFVRPAFRASGEERGVRAILWVEFRVGER